MNAGNDEALMTNDDWSPGMTKQRPERSHHSRDSEVRASSGIRHSPSAGGIIANNAQLAELVKKIAPHQRIAIDTEADSLHCYREKLCLVQISLPAAEATANPGNAADTPSRSDGEASTADPRNAADTAATTRRDFIVDPLADVDLAPLREVLEPKEIVLQGADFDLRMLRRGFNFTAKKVFDTVIASRLLGIRAFSLAALVKQYFEIELPKGSQKANWAQRPLSARMAEYAINDTLYLLPLAEKLEAELDQAQRLDWFRQSCQRAVEQAAMARVRDEEDVWRIRGSGALRGRPVVVLRALWQWREKEAEAVDRPPFHILQNHELLEAAEDFASGKKPDFRHFSERRRVAFRHAAEQALQLPEDRWPIARRRFGTRPTAEQVRRTEELRQRRDRAAKELKLEPAFVAPRGALETLAADSTQAEKLLVPWQRELLGL
ncbi:MAG: HRDC domain-containing protein [Verrucomicrobiota bacterium]